MPRHAHARPGGRSRLILAVAGAAAVVGITLLIVLPSGGHQRRVSAVAPSTTRQPVTTTTSPPPSIAAENARAGTPGWTVQHASTSGQIEGYADRVSAQIGDTVTLYVTSSAPSWTATAYRMGWYGGLLAREVWQSGPQRGVVQAAPARDPATNMISTRWAPSLAVPITTAWTPGDYLFKLTASSGRDSYVPLTVRDDGSHAPILVVNSVTTWQAYNLWGGYSLYSGPGGSRSEVVSFDRPYRLGDGSGDFLGNEERFVKLVEKEGLDVTYTTDVDLAERPALLLNHKVIVSLGHDEYYSLAMRAAVTSARDHGVNLIYLGANAVYRHIRLQPSALGPDREEINYRVARLDPLDGKDDADVTVQWREPPTNAPESTLLGEMYQCNPVHADMVVTDPTAWVFAGTGLTVGQHLPGLVGSEYDHYSPADPQPPGSGVQLMAQSPLTCRRVASTADFTYYVAPSGGGVIDVGTNLWVPDILSDSDPDLGATVAHITLTMLQSASAGPLGTQHPARPTPGVTAKSGPAPPTGD
jgi:hypothetical protein